MMPEQSLRWMDRLHSIVRRLLQSGKGSETITLRPDITLTFSFSRHGSAEHLKQSQRLFTEADVYIPEGIGNDPALFQALSTGKITPDEIEQYSLEQRQQSLPSYTRAEFDLIHNSHKPILIVDIPADHPARDKIRLYESRCGAAFIEFSHGRVETALQLMEEGIELYAEAQAEREQYIINKIKTDLPALKNNDPVLRAKPTINALLQWGSLHTTLQHSLRKDFPSRRHLDEQPTVFSPSEEIVRARRLHRVVRPELYGHELVEGTLFPFLPPGWLGTSRGNEALRHLMSPLTLDDVRQIGTALGNAHRQGDYSDDTARVILNRVFQRYQRTIPMDELGFKQLLHRSGK